MDDASDRRSVADDQNVAAVICNLVKIFKTASDAFPEFLVVFGLVERIGLLAKVARIFNRVRRDQILKSPAVVRGTDHQPGLIGIGSFVIAVALFTEIFKRDRNGRFIVVFGQNIVAGSHCARRIAVKRVRKYTTA